MGIYGKLGRKNESRKMTGIWPSLAHLGNKMGDSQSLPYAQSSM